MISIITTFRNEEIVLPLFTAAVEETLNKLTLPWEIIFVNDASTDGSLDFLTQKAARESRYKIITTSRRFGVQACLWAGLEHAKGSAVITIDTDLQDPPELIPELIAKWQAGADIVHTVRSSREGEGWFKKKLTLAAYRIISKFSEVPFPVEAGDFKLLNRRAVNELLKYREQAPYLRGLIASLGFKQSSVTYVRRKREAGESHFPVLSRGPIETFFAGLLSFSSFPFGFLAGLSLVFFLFSLLTGSYLAVSFLSGGNVPLTAWLIEALLIFGALHFFGMAFLGFYLHRVLKQTHQRPLYIIENKINL